MLTMRFIRQRRFAVGMALLLGGVVFAAGVVVTGGLSASPPSTPTATLDTSATPTDDRPPYDWSAPPIQDGLPAATLSAAQAGLKFTPKLPSVSVPPTAMYVSDPALSVPTELGFAAVVHDPKFGLFQVLEQPTIMTESQLEAWAQACNTCSIQKVVTAGQRHYLILASPGHGLAISWLSGATLYTIIGPEQTLTEANAVTLASNTT